METILWIIGGVVVIGLMWMAMKRAEKDGTTHNGEYSAATSYDNSDSGNND